MTIGIAAGLPEGVIVNISDRKITLGDFASDRVAEKTDFIHTHWTAMVSGDDITPAVPIWRRIRKKLESVTGEKTVTEVVDACISAYQEHRKEVIIARFYEPHGLTEERFLAEGKKLLGLYIFNDVWSKVDAFRLGCTFLVSGFDKDKTPHVFVVNDDGLCKDFGLLGFWAIGSGADAALNSIFFTLDNLEDFPQTLNGMLYDLCAAKFMSESSPHVGKATTVIVRKFGEKPEYYSDTAIETFRNLWKQGRPRRPEQAENTVKDLPKARVELKA